jgi:hypothetical protein
VFGGRHGHSGDRKQTKPTMSLTTSFPCKILGAVVKTEKCFPTGSTKLKFQRVKHENIQIVRPLAHRESSLHHPILRAGRNYFERKDEVHRIVIG